MKIWLIILPVLGIVLLGLLNRASIIRRLSSVTTDASWLDDEPFTFLDSLIHYNSSKKEQISDQRLNAHTRPNGEVVLQAKLMSWLTYVSSRP